MALSPVPKSYAFVLPSSLRDYGFFLCVELEIEPELEKETKKIMATLSQMFPSKFLSASDISDDTIVTIDKVEQFEVSNDGEQQHKPGLWFEEFDKPLILNKTNAAAIKMALGSDDIDFLPGKKLVLFITMTEYKGKPTEGIRIKPRPPQETRSAQSQTAQTARATKNEALRRPPQPPPATDDQWAAPDDDEPPF